MAGCLHWRKIAPAHPPRHLALREPLRASGLKLSQYSLLAQLSDVPQSLTALAKRMEIDRTTLTRSLQPLLDQGMVGESSGSDARQRLFVLSASGMRMRTAARKQWRQAQLALEEHLGRDFVANLHTQLEQACRV
jgi:DNA-binding MarR family transcriptional regulator